MVMKIPDLTRSLSREHSRMHGRGCLGRKFSCALKSGQSVALKIMSTGSNVPQNLHRNKASNRITAYWLICNAKSFNMFNRFSGRKSRRGISSAIPISTPFWVSLNAMTLASEQRSCLHGCRMEIVSNI